MSSPRSFLELSSKYSNVQSAVTELNARAANQARLRGERAQGASGAAAGAGHRGHARTQPAASRVPRRLSRVRALPAHARHRYAALGAARPATSSASTVE